MTVNVTPQESFVKSYAIGVDSFFVKNTTFRLLIKFCVVSNIIDIEISKEEERQKKTTAENAKLILDHLKELKGCLAEKETWKTILSEHKEKEVFNNQGVYSHYLD